jgi:hypothetical protein
VSRPLDAGSYKTWDNEAGERQADPQVGDAVGKLGRYFEWSHLHSTTEQLNKWRRIGDPKADALLERRQLAPGDDIMPHLDGEEFSAFPDWVDWESVRRGQRTWVRFLPQVSVTLFYVSLVGGFSAPKITEVLSSTGYLTGTKRQIITRIRDTGYMLFACMCDGGLRPGASGWTATLRVRFLHARVRARLLNRNRSRTGDSGADKGNDSGEGQGKRNGGGKAAEGASDNEGNRTADPHADQLKAPWSVEDFGVPINQEDMAVTLLAFSVNVLAGIERIMRRPLSAREQDDYIHLWRLIGWLIGLADECNPCQSTACATARMDSIIMHIITPDDRR